ncbi:MAG: HK97 family phage prohead protease [Rhodospirillaceae bacterium]|nr:HK97 family phage prohead protease [Rhodospirillaceae bacterium]
MTAFPIFGGELEIRARGRRRSLRGRFPYSQGAGDRMATVADRGRTRKERIASDAFGWQVREFQKAQADLNAALKAGADKIAVQGLRQTLERRNIHILAGHSFDKPLGDMLRGGAVVASTAEAVEFEVDLPDENAMPGYMLDTVRMVENGLAGGISPGFRVPPATVVPDAEGAEPEPGNPAVQVRVIRQAVLAELSIVTRPAYSETEIDARAMFDPAPATARRTPRWL